MSHEPDSQYVLATDLALDKRTSLLTLATSEHPLPVVPTPMGLMVDKDEALARFGYGLLERIPSPKIGLV